MIILILYGTTIFVGGLVVGIMVSDLLKKHREDKIEKELQDMGDISENKTISD